MDRALVPLLDDQALRADFVRAASQVRAWLRHRSGPTVGGVLDDYLGRQARRKNAVLAPLQREKSAGFDLLTQFRELEREGNTEAIGPAIDRTLVQARHVLADLDPTILGDTGFAQILLSGRHRANDDPLPSA